jgi:hypothetical protein
VSIRDGLDRLADMPGDLDRLDEQIRAIDRTAKRLQNTVEEMHTAAITLMTPPPAPPKAVKAAKSGPTGFDKDIDAIVELVKDYTMTSPEKLYSLIGAVRHLSRRKVEGDIVECGVWRGGSMHAVARALAAEGDTDRDLYLFDTFEGMTAPTENDVTTGGRTAQSLLDKAEKSALVWAVATIEDVRDGLSKVPYPQDRIHLVKGPVEETIPAGAPERIALLRLDTDWYESTRHELEHLYERLVPDGVLIIDDYESWQGSKKATDEFFATLDDPPLLHRAGRSRIGSKPRPAPHGPR